MELSDADIIRRAKLGQNDAFEVLVDRYRDAVYSICFSKCGNFADAQDLAQEAFIRAYINLQQLKDNEKFAPWLFKISYAVCADWFRERKYVSLPLDDSIAAALTPVEDEMFRHEVKNHVDNALLKLPETHKLTAVLHYMAGYTCNEISEILEISVGSVWERLRTARRQLKNSLLDTFSEEIKCKKPSKGLTLKVLSNVAAYEKEEIFSHMRALKAVFEYLGRRVKWDYLLATSGEAFSVYFGSNWTYHSRFIHSWDVAAAACKAFGFKGQWKTGQNFETALNSIEECIKSGVPVIAPGINPSISDKGGSESHYWFVITDIDRDKQQISIVGAGEKEAVVPYPKRYRHSNFDFGWEGITRCINACLEYYAVNPIFIVEPDENLKETEDIWVEVIKSAFNFANEKPLIGNEDGDCPLYYSGIDALNTWQNKLNEESAKQDFEESFCINIGKTIQGNCKRLEVSRRAAASYFHSLSEFGSGLPASDLARIAKHYEAEANLAQKLFNLYFDAKDYAEMQKAISRYPKPVYFTCNETKKFWNTFTMRLQKEYNLLTKGAKIVAAIADEEKAATKLLDNLIAEWGNISPNVERSAECNSRFLPKT